MRSFSQFFTMAALVLSTIAVAGCAIPMTPDDVRSGKSSYYDRKQYSVNRNYADVSRILNRKAHECFNVETRNMAHVSSTSNMLFISTYTPKISVTPQKTTLTLQRKESASFRVISEPEAGPYEIVVDVINKGAKGVQVNNYYFHVLMTSSADIIDRVEQWIKGTSTLCPELH